MTQNKHQEFLKQYKIIHEPFVRYCSSNAYGVMQTEDLVQETILATLQNFSKLKDKNKLLFYMIGTVRNIIKNQKRRKKFKGDWDEKLLSKLEASNLSPEIALDVHFLLKALDDIPTKQKEAILLFEVSGFSMKEISDIQQSSLTATKTRISRGRQLLKKRFSQDHKTTKLSDSLAAFSSILF